MKPSKKKMKSKKTPPVNPLLREAPPMSYPKSLKR